MKKPATRTLGLLAGYISFCWLTKLIFLTLVTYFYLKNHSPLGDVGDVVRANQIQTYGIAAALFGLTLQTLYPLTSTSLRDILPRHNLRAFFTTGFVTGAVLGTALLLGTALGGHYGFLGFYIKFDEVVTSLVSMVFFSISIFALCIIEEFIFRGRLEPFFATVLNREQIPVAFQHPLTVGATALVYLMVKYLQVDVELVEALNMILLSVCLSKTRTDSESHLVAAGFATGFYVLCHTLCSLPLFGQDVAGLILVRAPDDQGVGALLSGGAQGPENGLILSILLILYALQRRLRVRA